MRSYAGLVGEGGEPLNRPISKGRHLVMSTLDAREGGAEPVLQSPRAPVLSPWPPGTRTAVIAAAAVR